MQRHLRTRWSSQTPNGAGLQVGRSLQDVKQLNVDLTYRESYSAVMSVSPTRVTPPDFSLFTPQKVFSEPKIGLSPSVHKPVILLRHVRHLSSAWCSL